MSALAIREGYAGPAFSLYGKFNVKPLVDQLAAKPELWDQNTERTRDPRSPHHGCSDIWLRYNALENKGDDYRAWTEQHVSSWHPAYRELPALAPIVFNAMHLARATSLGGCLITRIPPGGQVKPHADTGWHPRFYNTKLYIPLIAPGDCTNYSGASRTVMGEGEVWCFDNTIEHAVVNRSKTEARVTLILSTRTEH